MVFASITFLFYFLPVFLLIYFIAPVKFRNSILLIASLAFYGWGEMQYIAIIIISILINYYCGLVINDSSDKRAVLAITIGIIANLLLLGYFKYCYFIFSNIKKIGYFEHIDITHMESIHLPLGISFFTFQAISYLVDVYRKDAVVERNPINVALYISMFPQLIAGPIVRFQSIAKNINKRFVSAESFFIGIQFFITGLAQKVLIANTVAGPADAIFSSAIDQLSAPVAWWGAACYTFQIYFDFAGYSNMAIGLGFMLGFKFPQNFNYPYIAQSIAEFWRRWHMSLSTWFRDYLYIPMGGNQVNKIHFSFNLFTVFFLCGLWHGADWNFIAWGIYHGFFLVVERVGLKNIINFVWRPVRHLYVIVVVMFGWVIFRADTIGDAIDFMGILTGIDLVKEPTIILATFIDKEVVFAIIFGFFAASSMIERCLGSFEMSSTYDNDKKIQYANSGMALGRFVAIYLVFFLALIKLASETYNPFIYYRF